MPTPIGSDSHDVRIWDCQEASGLTVANAGTDTGHDMTVSASASGTTLGVAGLGPGGLALDWANTGSFSAACEDGNESGPTLAAYSLSILVKPTGISNGGYTWGPLFCKSYNTGWSPPYEAIGLYWQGTNRTDYSWIACHTDSGGTGHALASSDWGLNAVQNQWNLLWQTWDGSTVTMGMHYINGSNVIVAGGTHTMSVGTIGLGSGAWFGPGFKSGTGFDRSLLGQYARMRIRNQAEPASYFASLLTLYRDGVAITALTQAYGPTGGGSHVLITGVGFVSGCTVTFGGSAASVTFLSSTQIVATTPAHAAGAVDVTVTNPDTSTATATNGFTYVTYTAHELASEILG